MTELLGNYFRFSGRLSRGRYWNRTLRLSAVTVAALGIFLVAVTQPFSEDIPVAAKGIGVLVILLSGISSLSLTIRRLHDRRKSGWWIFPFYILPQIGLSPIAERQNQSVILGVAVIATIFLIWGAVEIGFLRGREGPSAFGADPLEYAE